MEQFVCNMEGFEELEVIENPGYVVAGTGFVLVVREQR